MNRLRLICVRHGHAALLAAVAEARCGIGVGAGRHGVNAVFPRQHLARAVLHGQRRVLRLRLHRQRIQRRHLEVFQLHAVIAAAVDIWMLKGQRQRVTGLHIRAESLPTRLIVSAQQCFGTILHREAIIRGRGVAAQIIKAQRHILLRLQRNGRFAVICCVAGLQIVPCVILHHGKGIGGVIHRLNAVFDVLEKVGKNRLFQNFHRKFSTLAQIGHGDGLGLHRLAGVKAADCKPFRQVFGAAV